MPPTRTPAQSTPTPDRFIRPSEIRDLTGLSPTTCWRREKAGDFPARRRLSPGCVGWRLSEIILWMERRGASTIVSPRVNVVA